MLTCQNPSEDLVGKMSKYEDTREAHSQQKEKIDLHGHHLCDMAVEREKTENGRLSLQREGVNK